MKLNRLASIAILAGALASCTAYGQAPGYGPPPGSQTPYDTQRGYDNRGYDDRGYDDRYSPRVDVGFFYDELSPYGDWVYSHDHGWAWFPRNMHPQWRPYTDGRWVITEYGWTWVSHEPFGWATYHYGRWAWDTRFGWLWVPGTVWGPAWVSWQHGGGYVGWAPLPPSVTFEIGIGLRLGGLNLSIGIRPDAYSFVPENRFLESRLSGHLIPTARNVTIIHNTTNITNYTYIDNRVVNRGVELARIEKATGRRLQRLHVAEARQKARDEVAATEVRIYRPTKQKLDAVRVGSRTRAEPRAEAPAQTRATPTRRDAPAVVVAPRTVRPPKVDSRKIEKEERYAQQELQRYQAREKQKLDKIHAQENARSRAQTERAKVEKDHRAERAALQQHQRDAEQQLAARLKAQRDAATAVPPTRATPQSERKAVTAQNKQQKSKAQVRQEEKQAKAEQRKAAKKQGKNDKLKPPPA
jgi:hypothetical protein